MELGRIWNVGMVAVSDSTFAQLGRMNEDEEECPHKLVDSDSEDSGTLGFGFQRIPGPLDSDSADSTTPGFGFGILVRGDPCGVAALAC